MQTSRQVVHWYQKSAGEFARIAHKEQAKAAGFYAATIPNSEATREC